MNTLYSRSFPTPSFLAMNSCALDISDQSIKYGELFATHKGLRLGRFGQEDIPSGTIVSGKIENEEKLVEVLTKLRKREKLSFIRVSLPEEQMYLFTLSLPKMSRRETYDAVLLQIEEHIPLKAQDVVFDYSVASETDSTMLVEVSATSSFTIDSYLRAFEKSGLTPLSFELEAQAIARAVVPYDDSTTCMIVDFGKARTGISIAHAGRVFFTTTLDFGGIALTNAIASKMSIPFEKAEILKKAQSINSSPDVEDVFQYVTDSLSVLKDEIIKNSVFWQTHNIDGIAHDTIDRVILCGGDANLRGLLEYLQSNLKMKVVHANSWVNISTFSTSVPNMTFEQSLWYSTVLGLALGDYSYKFSRILNVLPWDKKKDFKLSYRLRFLTLFSHGLLVLSVFALILMIPSYLSSLSKEKNAEERLEMFNSMNKTLESDAISKKIEDINSKLSVLTKTEKNTQIVEGVILPLLDIKPNGIIFTSINYAKKDKDSLSVQISGIASDRETLSAFKMKLSSNPLYSSVDIPISNFLEKKNLSFNVSIILK